jgi:hypothetical protein
LHGFKCDIATGRLDVEKPVVCLCEQHWVFQGVQIVRVYVYIFQRLHKSTTISLVSLELRFLSIIIVIIIIIIIIIIILLFK